jgi:hypothetical protein
MSDYSSDSSKIPRILCEVLSFYDIIENASELLALILGFMKEDVHYLPDLLEIVEMIFVKKSNLSTNDSSVIELVDYLLAGFESEDSFYYTRVLQYFFERFQLDTVRWFKKCFKLCILNLKDLISSKGEYEYFMNPCLQLTLKIVQIFKGKVESQIFSTNFIEMINSLISVFNSDLHKNNVIIKKLILRTPFAQILLLCPF